MADKPCKIIAIVGICLACVVGLWLIGGLLTCIRQGVTGVSGFVCWCCNCNDQSSSPSSHQQQQHYQPQPMSYRQQPPNVIYQPIEPGYFNNVQGYDDISSSNNNNNNNNNYYTEGNKNDKNRNSVYEMEQDFDLEEQRLKSEQKHGGYWFQRQQPYPN